MIVVKALDKKDIAVGNKVNIRQKINFRDNIIVKLDALFIRDWIIAEALDKANIRGNNRVNIIKKPNIEGKIVIEV